MKSFVAAVVTVTFIFYSLYQRTFGMPETPVMAPSTSAITSSSSQNSPSSNSTQTPPPKSTPPTRSNPSQTAPGNPPNSNSQNTPAPPQKSGSSYKDGTYTGIPGNAFYGNIQVQVTIADGRIANIQFLQYPNDRSRSISINRQAIPLLTQEAIQAQSANVHIISGATDSSRGFVQSLQSALGKAKA